jgi:hypothetical protein
LAIENRQLQGVVIEARTRLTRIWLRTFTLERWPIVLGAAAALAALRPFVWRLRDVLPWHAPLRAVLLALAGAVVATVTLLVIAWRKRPSELNAARTLDAALGLDEVVASGFAFERDGRFEGMTALATERARAALIAVRVHELLSPPTIAPAAPRARRFALGAIVIGLLFGSLDPTLIESLVHPITERERTAAGDLTEAAKAAETAVPREAGTPRDTKTAALMDAARRAAEAAQRGDRKRAFDALDDLRAAERALEAEQRDRAKALRQLREDLEAASGGRDGRSAAEGPGVGRPSATASEALRRMLAELSSGTSSEESLREAAERLARAEAGARAASEAGASGGDKQKDAARTSWAKVANALAEANEAAKRGDRDAAKRALERAEREIASLERGRGANGEKAMSQMMRSASALDRALRSGTRGERGESPGKDGDGDGDGKEGAGQDGAGQKQGESHRGGKMAPSGKSPGGNSAAGDRTPGGEGRRTRVTGNLQARGDVGEGERAISAIQGMGKGDEARAFREVFPSYDSAVEDGLRDELVPAARRNTVRRYFSLIRPSEETP